MNTMGNHGDEREDDAVVALLEKAQPRLAPPSKDEEMIREAVQDEWRAVIGKRRARTRFTRFAVAATVVLGVAVSFNMLQGTGVAPVQVATISSSHGSIYMTGDDSKLLRLSDMSTISVGETIVTENESGLALDWGNGGSLRIAENTRVEFISEDEIYLSSGQVYFDSTPSKLIASISGGSIDSQFHIETEHGRVTHVGTQFITYSASDELKVIVREGKVNIQGNYHDEEALAGQQVSIVGSARATKTNHPRHGAAWRWIEETSPVASTDGRTVYEFLDWASRETGLSVKYPNAATEKAAAIEVLRGTVELEPRAALEFWLNGQELDWIIDEDGGTITVSAIDGSSGT